MLWCWGLKKLFHFMSFSPTEGHLKPDRRDKSRTVAFFLSTCHFSGCCNEKSLKRKKTCQVSVEKQISYRARFILPGFSRWMKVLQVLISINCKYQSVFLIRFRQFCREQINLRAGRRLWLLLRGHAPVGGSVGGQRRPSVGPWGAGGGAAGVRGQWGGRPAA